MVLQLQCFNVNLHFETLSAYSEQNINGLKTAGYDDF